MAASARAIPREAERGALAPDESADFERLAANLQRRAEALADRPETLTPAELRARLAAVHEACAACHARFRDAPLPADDR
jgi:cytochrome c556